jgi:hypothetical protein
MRLELRAALDLPGGLEAGELVDAIGDLESLGRTVTAAQASLTAELDRILTEEQAAAGTPADRLGQGVGHVVAHARRESPHRGRRHLSLARIVPTELPHTWAAWRDGRIDEWTATVIARETACLPLTHRLAVDEAVAGDADALERASARQLLARLRSEAERLDPAACVARRRKAESDRRVTLRPAPDSMVWLTALLPVKEGVATYAVLTREADTARASGDPRSRGQVMADTLVDSILDARDTRAESESTSSRAETASAGTDWPVTPDPDAPEGSPAPPPAEPAGATASRASVPVSLGLIMTDAALFAGADDEAHLDGFGPIPAELAREIVWGAATREEEISIRRLYTSPTAGELVAMESTARTFRSNLATFVRLRDQVCRTPWCDAPVRHVDHVVDAATDGPTSSRNGQGLCEACNYAKTAHRWRARPGPDGSVTTTLPTGHTYTSRPPPLVTVRYRADLPRLNVDYVLAG